LLISVVRIAAVELEGRNPLIDMRPAWDANVRERDAKVFETEDRRDLGRVRIFGGWVFDMKGMTEVAAGV